ncbi:hypothetical protein FACS189459_0700 [Bacilli bacterium]|nr:hypothetical protein FACS189459_0700 [Bacilli bacterium]
MTFPLIGIFLFSLFGTNPLKEEKECITDKRLLSNENYKETKKILKTSLNNLNIFRYVFNTQKHPIYGKNNVEIINKNEELLPIIISEIKKAKTSINICTYIIKEGYFLKTLINELIKLNLKGVKIRLMYDYVGSFQKIKSSTIKKIKAAGIEVSIFNHSKFNIFKSATNFRNHKKCIIIDNSVAILGSYNIGDEYLSIDSKTND